MHAVNTTENLLSLIDLERRSFETRNDPNFGESTSFMQSAVSKRRKLCLHILMR